jgi:multiple sugar transport system ATP-binding protein
MNLTKARVTGRPGALALAMQVGDRPRVHIDLPTMPAALDDYIGKEVIAGIRAEAISLARDGMVAGPMQRFVDARVEVIEPTGADTLIVINLGGHEFTARLDPDVSLAPGQEARFLVDLTKLVCFDEKTEALIA